MNLSWIFGVIRHESICFTELLGCCRSVDGLDEKNEGKEMGSVLYEGKRKEPGVASPFAIEVPGGVYHVIVRGNERKAVFRDDADRTKYLDRLSHYREKFSFRLLAYCLLDNHVHLAIETGKSPLSRTMAGLQSSYTQYFNRRHKRAGHLFQ